MSARIEIAEARARELSDDPQLFMLAYSAGWNTAADGGDLAAYARSLIDATADAGFIEGAAAWRATRATARDYIPGSAAHCAHVRSVQ
ncbi:hypothetical protein AB0I93_27000 [Streptomyces sp. NPDC049967]|uniref:hypothetical protein n=1 Tax=Streptomyces sp. NPDC049967 TaxID=3155658 RepID=UPI00344217EE